MLCRIVPTGVKVKELPSVTPAASSSAAAAMPHKKEERWECVWVCVWVCVRVCVRACMRAHVHEHVCACEGVVCCLLSFLIPFMCPDSAYSLMWASTCLIRRPPPPHKPQRAATLTSQPGRRRSQPKVSQYSHF